MYIKNYFILESSNNATYIINAKNRESINFSLQFYKARNIKQKLMKSSLKLYLIFLKNFCNSLSLNILKSQKEIEEYLNKINQKNINFNLDKNFSILISPTRDKVIVHHHNRYFQKFAFGKSYKNVRNEAMIYKLFTKPLQNFEISDIYELNEIKNQYCSFKLSNKLLKDSKKVNLTLALIEFFDISKNQELLFVVYIEELKEKLEKLNLFNSNILKLINYLKIDCSSKKIKLGLVHRDFKPWNIIIDNNRLLIYDFEETITAGLPLEDLFNFYIDPIIRYKDMKYIEKIIYSKQNINQYQYYLKRLEINTAFEPLLYAYLLERIIFWSESDDLHTTQCYKKLIKYLFKRNKIEA